MRGPSSATGGVPAFVELILLRLREDGRIGYRTLTGPVAEDDHPDAVALSLVDPPVPAIGTVCHSTSWRWSDGSIVLTYAMVPDPAPAEPTEPLDAPSVVTSGDALRPSPPFLHGPHVAAHAVRHLSFLAATDPTTGDAARARPLLWGAIDAAARTTPVGEHSDVHHEAEEIASGHGTRRSA